MRVSGEYECLMMGKAPLQPWGNQELVDTSAQHKLLDMFPMLPTIDLVPFNNYTVREHASEFCLIISAMLRKNLSSGFLTRSDTNRAVQP